MIALKPKFLKIEAGTWFLSHNLDIMSQYIYFQMLPKYTNYNNKFSVSQRNAYYHSNKNLPSATCCPPC